RITVWQFSTEVRVIKADQPVAFRVGQGTPEFRRMHLGPMYQHDGIDCIRTVRAQLIHGYTGIHVDHFGVLKIRVEFTHKLKGYRAAAVSTLNGEPMSSPRCTQVAFTVQTAVFISNDKYALLANGFENHQIGEETGVQVQVALQGIALGKRQGNWAIRIGQPFQIFGCAHTFTDFDR
ncbi:MAG: hypothetical protein GWO88_00700, partial [Planctomycetia bacterium]|nr:hypothetical protein [Planctomycetia bacterium]